MTITFERDGTARRVLATISPGERFANYEREVATSLDLHPDWVDWDLIIDDQGPLDDITVDGMARIAEMYNRRTRGVHSHTVVITSDPYFAPWGRVMNHHFGNRTHHKAPTVAAARALLDRLEAAERDGGTSQASAGGEKSA